MLDEADPASTKLFHAKLKVCVTGDKTWSRRSGEVDHQLPAHHRFVALSNNIDGLFVDLKSGNRRFVLFQPTVVFATPQPSDRAADLVTPEARRIHNEEYIRRFVSPGVGECVAALFQHLANLPVKYRTTARWEEAGVKVMAASPLSSHPGPPPSMHQVLVQDDLVLYLLVTISHPNKSRQSACCGRPRSLSVRHRLLTLSLSLSP